MAFTPDALKAASLTIEAITNAAREASPYSFAQTVYNFQGGMWSAELDLAHLSEDDHRAAWGWLVGLEGPATTFQMYAPDYTGSAIPFAANPTLSAEALVRSNALVATVGPGEAFTVGDYLTLGQNLHMVTLAAAPGSGVQAFEVWPRMRADHAVGAAVIADQPFGNWAISGNKNAYARQLSGERNQRIKLVEAL
jgi:hypothetical protein